MWAVAALDVLEAIDGHMQGPHDELEQVYLVLCGPLVETWTRPESLNHLVHLLVLVGKPHSVVHVDLYHPLNEQLQLVPIEDVHHIEWQHVSEPLVNAQNCSTFFLKYIMCIQVSEYRTLWSTSLNTHISPVILVPS